MKRAFKILIAVFLAALMLCVTACDVGGGNGGSSGGDGTTCIVTFMNNYEGAANAVFKTVSVTSGERVSEPNEKPTRPDSSTHTFTFDGWFKDEGGVTLFDFGEAITADTTIYAGWQSSPKEVTPPATYKVTFVLNFGSDLNKQYATATSDESGHVAQPSGEPTRPPEGNRSFTFKGWFKDRGATQAFDFSTDKITETTTLYAGWNETVTPVTCTVTFHNNYVGAANDVFKTVSVTSGESVSRPDDEPSRPDSNGKTYTFKGWYTTSACTTTFNFSSKITSATDIYAGWNEQTPAPSGSLTITSFGSYEEGAYIEFSALSGVSNYTVSYKKSGGNYVTLSGDDAKYLVRKIDDNDTWRADVVGISSGEYTIRVEGDGKTAEKTVTVKAYDRSGYAHWESDGGVASETVGAYQNSGVPKSNARIVYVTEQNKNSVTVDGISGSGIVAILNNANANTKKGEDPIPLIVRIVGTVGSATWKDDANMDYKNKYEAKEDGKWDLGGDKILDKNGKVIPTSSSKLSQTDITDGNYNDLDESKYSVITGLTSQMSYDSDDKEWDSYWNMCDIKNVSNVTVEGIGTDACIFQWGFTWKNCNSIEVRNLTFEAYPEDACSFEGSTNVTEMDKFDSNRIWVHNNTFLQGKNYWDVCREQDKHEGDGATDFKKCAYITLSYNHYLSNHKTGLIGGGDSHYTACVTFHHNYYDQCNSRLPLARRANMHMYNNYYYGSTGTNMSIRANGYAFIEYCYFDNAKYPVVTESNGVAKLWQCKCDYDQKENDKGKLVTSATVVEAVTRSQKVTNYNEFDDYFDIDSTKFYYDSSNQKTLTQSGFEMLTATEVKTQIPLIAGVHKN